MLTEISIENLGAIESASAEFADGLTVLTGETGAGKTMLVTGLRLLAGARADASRVRQGSSGAVVEGRFALSDAATADAAAALVAEAGGQADENDEYIAARMVSAAGRSKAYLGGRSVPAATLGEFARHVITVHGQNDQLRLRSPEQQLAALDRSAAEIPPLLEAYQCSFKTWRTLSKDYVNRTQSRREIAQEVDRLRFSLDEIAQVAPEPGEDVELVALIARLQDVDGLREASARALGALDGDGAFDEASASSLVGSAQSALENAADPVLRALGERLAEIATAISDVAGELGTYVENLPTDPNLLEQSLQRQQALKTLTRKYAADIDGVLAWAAEAEQKLEGMDTSTEALEALKAEVMAAEQEMIAAAGKLTKARSKAAEDFAARVTEELHGLAMASSTFGVAVTQAKYSRTGADEVELQLNGRPLAQSASGGELSRVMLAIEVVLAANTSGMTMVFDEVDAGVGGRAAVEIGRRLARLAARNQVIVVTHLPQVAAYAHAHVHVAKDAHTSGVSNLSASERVEELARMLAGLDDTETGRAHAQELFDRAQEEVAAFAASPRA